MDYCAFQVRHLDYQESGVILANGLLTFLPLESDKEDSERNKHILKLILKRS